MCACTEYNVLSELQFICFEHALMKFNRLPSPVLQA